MKKKSYRRARKYTDQQKKKELKMKERKIRK